MNALRLFLILLLVVISNAHKTISANNLPPIARLEESGTCWVNVPSRLNVKCFQLIVPEDREKPNGRWLKLPVIIIKSRAAQPDPDPILVTGGGPGGGSLNLIGIGGLPWANHRDLVIIEQRGTGFSSQVLDCPELKRALYQNLGTQKNDQQQIQALLNSTTACRERLEKEGVNLSKYNTLEISKDIEDLRQALKVDQWNLFGISYSTKIMLTYMRDYPNRVRSAILDSPMPLSIGYDETAVDNYVAAFQQFAENYKKDNKATKSYQDVSKSINQTTENLNKKPYLVNTIDPYTQKPLTIRVKGNEFATVFFPLLNRSELLPYLPFLSEEFSKQNYELLAPLAKQSLPKNIGMYLGMRLSVNCTEEVPFEDMAKIKSQRTKHAQLTGFREESIPVELCSAWRVKAVDPKENLDVTSSVPTLILSGEYDVWTPANWGSLLSKSLSKSYHLTVKGAGHGVFASSNCMMGITHEFYLHPGVAPNSTCMDQEKPMVFLTPTEINKDQLSKMIGN